VAKTRGQNRAVSLGLFWSIELQIDGLLLTAEATAPVGDNWTSNRLYAEGSPEQISDFLQTVKGKNGVLDFDAVIPAPELLSHTASGARNIDGQEVTEWYVIAEADHAENRPAKVRIFTPEEEAELNNIGHRSWYDWNNNNWGTKWNACDPEIEDEASKQYGYVRITVLNRPIRLHEKDNVSDLESSRLAGLKAFIWSNLCTRHIPEKLTSRGHHDWPDKPITRTRAVARLMAAYP
jgi:hypothetical protein